jgi:hypothetical protein
MEQGLSRLPMAPPRPRPPAACLVAQAAAQQEKRARLLDHGPAAEDARTLKIAQLQG